MKLIYKLVSEWASPTYYDYKTNEMLYDECDSSAQRLWVVSYDPEEHEIIEWLQDFTLAEEDKANEYIKKLEKGETDMVECANCGEKWTEQELNSYAWHCLRCGHKIGD